MSSYRFCRTDDIGLLVGALNRCWAPHFPDAPPMTEAAFKRSIRDLQVWCSSCMVAFSGSDPIGVLIGAKRPSGTLVYKVAIHPEHVRQGHARHLLDSLSSKLAILGPPTIIVEVPEAFAAAHALFQSAGYSQDASMTDFVLDGDAGAAPGVREAATGFAIPMTVDDLIANGLLEGSRAALCWERSVETIMARRNELSGLAIASDERIEAYLLFAEDGEILSLQCAVDDDGRRVGQLLSMLRARIPGRLRLAKVQTGEIPTRLLDGLGFRPAGTHVRYQTRAQQA